VLKRSSGDADRRQVEGPVIETRQLSRRFNQLQALDDLTMAVQPGEVVALLGPNGAGKTTTMRLLNGVLRPDSGSASVLGLDPTRDGDAVRRRTGVLTEHAGLEERLTVEENLLFTGRVRNMAPARLRQQTDDLLERVGMADRAKDLVRGMSTGQRKRIALARALLDEPEVLLLDEPTSGLDPAATREVVDFIADLAAQGTSVLLCTHFLGEAGRLASRMAVLWQGRLRAFGTPTELSDALWHGLRVDVEIDVAEHARAIDVLTNLAGVLHVEASKNSLSLVVPDRSAVPVLLHQMHREGFDVFAATPHTPSLEDVYFAVISGIEGAPA
jgi:ABC-2 type transport system ATP-binding protein